MSCFVLSDNHICTIAARVGMLYEWEFGQIKGLADKMKKVNLESVNIRYARYTKALPLRGVNKITLQNTISRSNTGFTDNDIAGMIYCWDYQSDNAKSIDYIQTRSFLFGVIDRLEWKMRESSVWDI